MMKKPLHYYIVMSSITIIVYFGLYLCIYLITKNADPNNNMGLGVVMLFIWGIDLILSIFIGIFNAIKIRNPYLPSIIYFAILLVLHIVLYQFAFGMFYDLEKANTQQLIVLMPLIFTIIYIVFSSITKVILKFTRRKSI